MVAAFVAAGAYAIGVGTIGSGAALLGLAALAGLALRLQRALPSSIMLLLFAVAAGNAAGYVINLWQERTMFDEVIHALTTFAVMTALIWVTARDTRLLNDLSGLAVVASALMAGLILGLAWEGFEWLVGIIGNQRDTLIDLGMDSLGAVAAGLLFSSRQARRVPHSTALGPR